MYKTTTSTLAFAAMLMAAPAIAQQTETDEAPMTSAAEGEVTVGVEPVQPMVEGEAAEVDAVEEAAMEAQQGMQNVAIAPGT
ncbi:MAG: hypothetical protein AAF311_09955 [Pseudomonadota bacterium]